MPITLNPSLTRRDYTWDTWKEVLSFKRGLHQFHEEGGYLTVWFYDGPEVHVASLQRSDTEQLADFDANYRDMGNATLETRAKDGRLAVRNFSANRTTSFKLRAITFYSSMLAESLHNVNPLTDRSYEDVTVRLFKEGGDEVKDAGEADQAVRTVVDFNPIYSYEIMGGYLDLPGDLKDGATDQWYLSAIGAPDYAPELYGSIDFISEVNLEAVPSSRVVSDNRAATFMPYQGEKEPRTNRLRFILKHPPGARKRFQLCIEHYA